ncbi:MAG: hypothetical protein IJI38_06050, partial [Clostridia bacterium]|nr:hypothetical protein [Clostridia bacterium]
MDAERRPVVGIKIVRTDAAYLHPFCGGHARRRKLSDRRAIDSHGLCDGKAAPTVVVPWIGLVRRVDGEIEVAGLSVPG